MFARLFRRRKRAVEPRLQPGFTVFTESFTEMLDHFQVDGPVCHVGAKDHGKTEDGMAAYRRIYERLAHSDVVGVDIFPGLNVDLVADLCAPDLFERHPDLKGGFGFVYCSALMEHVADPFAAARNIAGLLRPGGQIYYTSPWVCGWHPYPDDYWRISFSGLKVLFPAVEWRRKWYAGTKAKIGIAFEDSHGERKMFKTDGASGFGAILSDRSMPYLNISAIGVLPADT